MESFFMTRRYRARQTQSVKLSLPSEKVPSRRLRRWANRLCCNRSSGLPSSLLAELEQRPLNAVVRERRRHQRKQYRIYRPDVRIRAEWLLPKIETVADP